MFLQIESLINMLFMKLLERKISFYFVEAVLKLIENPSDSSLLKLIKLCEKDYENFDFQFENIIPSLINCSKNNKRYNQEVDKIILNSMSDYCYTFEDRTGGIVQSSLIFLLMQILPENCMKGLLNFLCEKNINHIVSRPQISSSAYIFSSLMHTILERGWDEIGCKIAKKIKEKHLLFIKNAEGLFPLDVAIEKDCPLSANYLNFIKQNQLQSV